MTDLDLRAPGQFTDRDDGFNLADLVAHGYEWFSYQCYNPQLNPWRADHDLAPARAAGFRSVGVWVCTYDQAQFRRDGEASAQQALKLGADHVVVDAEMCAKFTRDSHGMKPFIDGLRAGGWNGPVHLSSLGAPSNAKPHGPNDFGIDSKSFLDTGGGVLPQAYYNAYSEYRPDLCMDYWVACGVPRERINLTIEPNISEGRGQVMTGADWVPYLEDAGVKRNFSVFMTQFLVQTDLVALDKLSKQPPPPPPSPDPKDCRAQIVLESERWLSAQKGPQTLARLRIIHRIAGGSNVDAKWNTVRDEISALLDGAGVDPL